MTKLEAVAAIITACGLLVGQIVSLIGIIRGNAVRTATSAKVDAIHAAIVPADPGVKP